MYFPFNDIRRLRLPRNQDNPEIYCSSANRERTIVAAVTANTLFILTAHPQLVLAYTTRSQDDIVQRGEFRKILWRFDSSSIAVLTSHNHILIYRVEFSKENCYNLVDSTNPELQRRKHELFLKVPRPQTRVDLAVVVNLAARASCAVAMREELFVCLMNGFVHRISWHGQIDAEYTIRMSAVPFAYDQLQSRTEFIPDGTFIADAVYAPLVGGYSIVLSDGRAALLTSSHPRFHPNTLLGVWATDLKDACCVDVNHKHRLLVFGCLNGEIAGYHIDESSGALVLAYRTCLSVRDGPDFASSLSYVARVCVLVNGTAFGVIWKLKKEVEAKKDDESKLPPVIAIFSAYGALIWSSLECCFSISPQPAELYSIDWGAEGMQIWLAQSNGLHVISIAKSATIGSPTMEHSERIILITNAQLLLSPPREREQAASAPFAVWSTIGINHDYIASNWPIRYAVIDPDGEKNIAIAGTHGLTHYNLLTSKWKIFGNESQERDMMVTGGLFIWRGVVGAACCQTDSSKEWLRFYPLSAKLDNRYCSKYATDSRVLALNRRDDCLVTFDMDSRIMLFRLSFSSSGTGSNAFLCVEVDKVAEIRVNDLIPHPACLVSIHITELEPDKSRDHSALFMRGVDTVLVNVSGRVITLNPKSTTSEVESEDVKLQLRQPIVIASYVEQLWHDTALSSTRVDENPKAEHLLNAIWINCGSKGMRVWLPLLPGRRSTAQQDSFIARRIMLPFTLDIRPIVISSAECIAVGVESQSCFYGSKLRGIAVNNVHRNSAVFLHHILKELLKRNLGLFAVEVATSCRHLPYFPHALELLLHGVLEEEATSSEPIPDPLLPRIVAFIQEFPEFLKTVAHCARKTELALWPALFAVTGSPNDIFEICLRDGELETAASYLIVLQNIENSATSQEQATRLLREALSAGAWELAGDMLRFTAAIDADDIESQPRTPPPNPQRAAARRKGTTSADDELMVTRFQAAPIGKTSSRIRHDTQSNAASRKDSGGSARRLSKALSSDLSPSSSTPSNAMLERMQAILKIHAANLLRDYCIRDLGFFAAHLDFDLPHFFTSADAHLSIRDYPAALTRLHSQFEWPYPVADKHVVDHLVRKLGKMKVSQSTMSLTGAIFPERPVNPANTASPIIPNIQENGRASDDVFEDDASAIIQVAKLRPAEPDTDLLASSAASSDYQMPMNSSTIAESSSPGTSSLTPGTPRDSTIMELSGLTHFVDSSIGRGNASSDRQLLHILEAFKQSNAVEWVFLLCLLRRDCPHLRSYLDTTKMRSLPIDTIQRLHQGCDELLVWGTQMCPDYIPWMRVFRAHIELTTEAAGQCLNLMQNETKLTSATINGQPKGSRQKVPGGAKRVPFPTARADLRAAFDPPTSLPQQHPRRRERSRSVDRSHAVSTAEAHEADCALM